MGVRCWDYNIIILSSIQVTRANGGARALRAPPWLRYWVIGDISFDIQESEKYITSTYNYSN